MSERCVVCGTPGRNVQDKDGTAHFEPIEPKVLVEGVGAEYARTGVWMVWGGELGQLPWTRDTAVKGRRVRIVEVPDKGEAE